MLTVAWVLMVALALVYALLTGNTEALTRGAFDGASQAVTLCIAMAGALALWSGVMAVMRASGISRGIARLLAPLLGLLFSSARRDKEAMEHISTNVSANLLGLGNAATPAGVAAAKRLQQINGGGTVACKDLATFLVINTASIQLIPATVGGMRAGMGAASPFDILLPVWVTSLLAVTVAVGLIKTFQFVKG